LYHSTLGLRVITKKKKKKKKKKIWPAGAGVVARGRPGLSLAAAERRRKTIKGFKGFHLEDKAIIWP